MKKFIALLSTVMLCMSSFSCSGGAKQTAKPENTTAQQLSDIAYKRSIVDIPEELMQIYCFKPYNDSRNFFILGAADTTPAFYTADSSFTNFARLEIPEFSIGAAYDIAVANDGSIAAFVNEVDYGGLPEPDIYAEDYDAELYENAAEYTLMISKFSIGGKLISSNEVKDLPVNPDGNTQLSGVYSDGETAVVSIDGCYYMLDMDGNCKGELKTDSAEKEILQLGTDSLNNLVCAVDCGEDKLKICRVNTEKNALEESEIVYNFDESVAAEIVPGTGDYSMFLTSRTTIYGIRRDDSSIEPVFSIAKSSVIVERMKGFFADADGTFVFPDNGTDYLDVKLRRFTPCTPEELAAVPVLKIACVEGLGHFDEFLVSDFNDTHGDYQIEVVDYSQYATEANPDGGSEQFALDIISEDAPDIIVLSGIDHMKLDEKGAFADLYEFIDNDETLTRESFLPNVIDFCETDGHLYSLPTSFEIFTAFAKTKFCGGYENWTIDEYIGVMRNLPESMRETNSYYDSKEQRFSSCGYMDFIDFENGTCCFDSPEFIRVLEYSNEAPSEPVGDGFDFFTATEEEILEYERELSVRAREDRELIGASFIYNYESYHEMKYGTFAGADLTCVGMPSLNGNGTRMHFLNSYAINAKSDKKELAWEFLRQFYLDDYYGEDSTALQNFAVTISGLEAQAELAKNKSYEHYDDDTYDGMYYHMGEEKEKIGKVSDEDVETVNELIFSIDTLYRDRLGQPVYEIIYEERDRYFYGECTAKECAETIQSRLSIYLAEQS